MASNKQENTGPKPKILRRLAACYQAAQDLNEAEAQIRAIPQVDKMNDSPAHRDALRHALWCAACRGYALVFGKECADLAEALAASFSETEKAAHQRLMEESDHGQKALLAIQPVYKAGKIVDFNLAPERTQAPGPEHLAEALAQIQLVRDLVQKQSKQAIAEALDEANK